MNCLIRISNLLILSLKKFLATSIVRQSGLRVLSQLLAVKLIKEEEEVFVRAEGKDFSASAHGLAQISLAWEPSCLDLISLSARE